MGTEAASLIENQGPPKYLYQALPIQQGVTRGSDSWALVAETKWFDPLARGAAAKLPWPYSVSYTGSK